MPTATASNNQEKLLLQQRVYDRFLQTLLCLSQPLTPHQHLPLLLCQLIMYLEGMLARETLDLTSLYSNTMAWTQTVATSKLRVKPPLAVSLSSSTPPIMGLRT